MGTSTQIVRVVPGFFPSTPPLTCWQRKEVPGLWCLAGLSGGQRSLAYGPASLAWAGVRAALRCTKLSCLDRLLLTEMAPAHSTVSQLLDRPLPTWHTTCAVLTETA